MRKFYIIIFLISCSDETRISVEDLNKFYLYCKDLEVKNYFISNFDTNFYKFLDLKNLSELKNVNNLIVILTSFDKDFPRFYKFINSNFGYKLNAMKDGDFLLGIFGENNQDLKYYIYKHRKLIDSILQDRVYKLAYKRAYYFGVDKEKTETIYKYFNINLNIPVGWNFLKDSLIFKKDYFTMFKKNPDRFFTLYVSNSLFLLDYNNVLELTRKFIVDSIWNLKILLKNFNRICLDGSYIKGHFRSCILNSKDKSYFYNIEVRDTSFRDAFLQIIEIESFLSRMQ